MPCLFRKEMPPSLKVSPMSSLHELPSIARSSPQNAKEDSTKRAVPICPPRHHCPETIPGPLITHPIRGRARPSSTEPPAKERLRGKRENTSRGHNAPEPAGAQKHRPAATGRWGSYFGYSGNWCCWQRNKLAATKRCDTTMNRLFLFLGFLLVAIGLLWPLLSRLPWGRLPGDIVIQRPGFTFVFPITTCIVISVVLSLIFWLLRR